MIRGNRAAAELTSNACSKAHVGSGPWGPGRTRGRDPTAQMKRASEKAC